MKHKVSELSGALLDTAVALAEGWQLISNGGPWIENKFILGVNGEQIDCSVFRFDLLPWSRDWEHGGPIIDRERIAIWPTVVYAASGDLRLADVKHKRWAALHPESRQLGGWRDNRGGLDVTARDGMPGLTALVAGMRAWVQAKFGDEIDLS